MRTKENITYLNHILDCITDIESFVAGYTKETFVTDKKTFNSCIRMFEVIGEATKRLSSEIKNKHAQVSWKEIAGLRDILIHDYEGVDILAVWNIIRNDIPPLKTNIQIIINSLT